MAGLLLDTTVLIDALRGRPAAHRLRSMAGSHDVPFICAVNVEEIWRGTKPNEIQAVSSLLGALRIAPLGLREGEQAGRWRAQFAAAGVTLGQADCLIAAAALGIGGRLATGNPKDFPMDDLTVEHWPVDE